MAEAQMSYLQTKIDNLIEALPVSDENPTKKLEESIESWGALANERDVFSLVEVSLLETVLVMGTCSDMTTWIRPL